MRLEAGDEREREDDRDQYEQHATERVRLEIGPELHSRPF